MEVKGARWKGFETVSHTLADTADDRRKRRPMVLDMDKVRSTLKQLVRDWSEEVSTALQSPLHPDLILV